MEDLRRENEILKDSSLAFATEQLDQNREAEEALK